MSTDGTTTGRFGHDATGNMTSREVPGHDQTLRWGARGKLTEVSAADGSSTEFVYDADGKRLLRRSPSGTTLYLNGQQLRLDADSGEVSATRYYAHAGSTVAVRESGAGLTWLASDHQGTSKLAIDAESLEVTRRRFMPFGSPRGAAADFPGDKGFVGGTVDASVGLVALGARHYDPGLGRFVSVDPLMDISDPQQMHGYTYANNSPLTFSDASGLMLAEAWTQPEIVPDSYWENLASGSPIDTGSGSSGGGSSRPSAGNAVSSSPPAVSQEARQRSINNSPACQYGGMCGGPPPPSMTTAEFKKVAHTFLDVAGIFPVLGAAADGVNCAWYAAEGKAADAALSCTAIAPGAGQAVTAAKLGLRGADEVAGAVRSAPASKKAARCAPNSFVPGTAVLLADGSSKPIEEVERGDRVMATDPATGETVPRTVVATITGRGEKDLVEVTVDTDGRAGDATGLVVATGEHPFWVDDQGRWVRAEDLQVGDELRTPGGRLVEVADTHERTRTQRVHNLSVAGIHTYHVLAGTTPVLVHNSWCSEEERLEDAFDIAGGHAARKHGSEFPGVSSEGLGQLTRSIMENPLRTKELGSGRKAYLGKDTSTIVIHDPMHPDGGTVFRRSPATVDEYWDGLD